MSGDAAEPAVALDGVAKSFDGVAALERIDARIAAGHIAGLVGPDGAGKTTLLRLIAGLLRPDRGSLRVLGRDGAAEAEALRAHLAYMPQSFGLYEDLSVQENLDLYADLRNLPGRERRRRFDELLSFTGLGPFRQRLAGRLSGGMAQKLGLACTLVRPPRLLLLDEPSAGVDPLSRRELWDMVATLAGEGMTVLWSTAYLDEAERCCQVLVLESGRLVYGGAPGDFTQGVAGRCHVLRAPRGRLARAQRRALERDEVVDAVVRGSRLRLVMAEDARPPAPHELLDGGAKAAEIESVEPRFEDAFVAALRRDRGRSPAAAPLSLSAEAAVPDGEPAIEGERLTRRFGTFTAVDGLDFRVERGEIFGLLGPNGAGKSTTFKMLCGLLPPSAGRARIAGIELLRAAATARERIGYMAQHFSLYGTLTVAQNLRFFAGAYGLERRRRRRRIAEVSAELGLEEVAGRIAGELPLGFRQRLSLACAVLHEPAILFLDEPTSGVDPLTRRAFWLRITAMAEQGVTVLVTTHFMEEAEYCGRVAIVLDGRIVALDTPDGLREAHATRERPEPSMEEVFVDLVRKSRAQAERETAV